jgi:hypothetical protein
MNSIPMISHHLFVAAVKHEERAPERPRRRALAPEELPVGTSRDISYDAAEAEPDSGPNNLAGMKNRPQL